MMACDETAVPAGPCILAADTRTALVVRRQPPRRRHTDRQLRLRVPPSPPTLLIKAA
jgi:hypothetical protein